MLYEKQSGVPRFRADVFKEKSSDYVLLIPVINEGERIARELARAKTNNIDKLVDIVICDGGSTDNSLNEDKLKKLGVNSLLTKMDSGKQGAQLRMGIFWSLARKYQGILTIDGNDKDSIEDIPRFIEKLKSGYDFIQGSRFIRGGKAINTPLTRYLAVRLIHAPLISITAGKLFTDTTNAYRAYSSRYLGDKKVLPLRDIFNGYELLAYLSVRASQLGYKVAEIPVARCYPKTGKTPTKISFFRGNFELLKVLFKNLFGAYKP